MMTIRFSVTTAAAAALTLLAGCAADGPATNGAAVRSAMAAQFIDPQPRAHAPAAADGAAAVAAYANYKQSYASPQAQGDTPLVGARK